MQKLKMALFGGVMLMSGMSFAAEQAPVFADHHHVWHCTAYADGHNHDPRYSASASDEHRHHAYSKAVNRCERKTGHHCHHVDCHQH